MSHAKTNTLAMLGCLLAMLGCNAARTQVMVVVDADQVVRAEASSVHLTVSAGASFANLSPVAEHTLDDLGDEWPFYLPIIPADNDASRVFRVEVTALDSAGAEIVTARRQTGFVLGQTLALPIFLEASCRNTPCGDDQSCTGGACASAYVPPESLAPYVPPTQRDAGPTATDGGREAGRDAGTEAGTDAGTDGATPNDGDVVPDAGFDANFDAGRVICGNGVEEFGEECDDGVNDGAYGGCAVDCRSLAPYCGDRTVDVPIENCDDPSDVRCMSTCTWVPVLCGDGIPARGEICLGALLSLPVPALTTFEISAGELDGDGDADLIASVGGTTYVLANNGAGVFTPTTVPLGDALEIAVHELTGDGVAEILVAAPQGSVTCAALGCLEVASFAGGIYTRLFSSNIFGSGATPIDLQVGYANSDAVLDLVVAFSNQRADIAFGGGGGSFGGVFTGFPINGAGVVRVGVLDRDVAAPRRLFLVSDNGWLEMFDLDAMGRFSAFSWAQRVDTTLSGSRAKATLVQVGGRPVLAMVGGEPVLQAFDAATSERVSVPTMWMTGQAGAIVAADFDSDGLTDLAASNLTAAELAIMPNTGTGFGARTLIPSLPCSVLEHATADFNRDGAPDLALGMSCGVYVMLSNP